MKNLDDFKKQEILEHLIKCAEKVARSESEYLTAKHNLEILKAQFILKNDWPEVLGKAKPTQKEKDAFIVIAVEEQQNLVNELKLKADYCRRVYELNVLRQKEMGK